MRGCVAPRFPAAAAAPRCTGHLQPGGDTPGTGAGSCNIGTGVSGTLGTGASSCNIDTGVNGTLGNEAGFCNKIRA